MPFPTFENDSAAVGELYASSAIVEIDGQVNPHYVALYVERSTGVLPSKAVIRSLPYSDAGEMEVTSPVTLNAVDYTMKHGSRVRIYAEDDSIYFVGTVLGRQDQGQEDSVIWTAYDDRVLLYHIPVRGCLVREGISGDVKFISRFQPRTNPEGFWNCTGASISIGGTQVVVPVFSESADLGKVYQTPNEAFTTDLADDGSMTGWTPRRFLLYLWALCHITADSGVLGVDEDEWRHIADSQRIAWDRTSIDSLVGKDPAQVIDPLDRKMPDTNFQGHRLLGAIQAVLDAAGTHGFRTIPAADDSGDATVWRSQVDFYPKNLTAYQSANPKQIPLQRGGQADLPDCNTAYDFDLFEDAKEVDESALVEGQPVHVESQLVYDPSDLSNSTLLPMWNSIEEQAFQQMVFGNDGTTQHDWALYPKRQMAVNPTALPEWLEADGSGNVPPIKPGSPEALTLARACLPRVYRVYQLASSTMQDQGLMDGSDGEYEDYLLYPVLNFRRPILPEQLQFLFYDNGGGVAQDNWIKTHYPIRVETKANEEGALWVQVDNASVQVRPDGSIWMNGVTDEMDGDPRCLYAGNFTGTKKTPLTVAQKCVRLNCAFPLDHRVKAYKEITAKDSLLHPDYRMDLGGPPLKYLDCKETFFERHQINSYPASVEEYFGGNTVQTQPLTRKVPPGSEIKHAEYQAQRELWNSRFMRRHSHWKMIGIRPEYEAGDWIDAVFTFVSESGNPTEDENDPSYRINAPVETVLLDFQKWETVLGGMVSTIG